jgi:nitrate reductase gamma subunit
MTQRHPWGPTDLVVAVILHAIGFAGIVAAWAWTRAQDDDARQLTGVAVAIGALLLAGLGTLTLLMNARRSVTQRTRVLAEEMASR